MIGGAGWGKIKKTAFIIIIILLINFYIYIYIYFFYITSISIYWNLEMINRKEKSDLAMFKIWLQISENYPASKEKIYKKLKGDEWMLEAPTTQQICRFYDDE